MLLEGQPHAGRRGQDVLKRCRKVVVHKAQATGQLLDGDAPGLVHGVGGDRVSLAQNWRPIRGILLQELLLDALAGFPGKEVFRTGVQGAEAAFAAQLPPLVPAVLAGDVKQQAPHHLVRLDLVAQQVSRAQLGAVGTLVAGRLADPMHGRLGFPKPRGEGMVAGKHDDAARRLGHTLVQVMCQASHHRASDHDRGIGGLCASGRIDELAEGDAHRHPAAVGPGYRAGNGEPLVRDGCALERCRDVAEGLDVQHDSAHVERDTGRRNEPAGGLVDEDEFVAGGVEITQDVEADRRGLAGLGEGLDGIRVLCLDANDAGGGAHGLHHGAHAGDDVLGVSRHQLCVLVHERFALGPVADHVLRLCGHFHVRGKAAAACTYHAGRSNTIGERHITSLSSCGDGAGMTTLLTSRPRLAARAEPASTAAWTAATSPVSLA